METIQIREMQASDLPVVVDFWYSIHGIGMSSDDNPTDLALYLCHNPGLSFAAFFDHEIVGAVLCGQDGRRGYINHLAVSKDWRRHGLGKQLVNCCLEALLKIGIKKCHIFVFQKNHSAITFWKQTGWEYREELIIMSRRFQ